MENNVPGPAHRETVHGRDAVKRAHAQAPTIPRPRPEKRFGLVCLIPPDRVSGPIPVGCVTPRDPAR
jgi:hypothetical protein